LKSTPGNLFFSPYSISTCLAMTYAGARGDTEKQMAQVFRFTKDQAELHSSFGALQRDLREAEKQKGIELNIANALWAQSGHPFLAEFLKVAQTEYEANVNQADFKTQAGAVTEKINRWVAEKTKDKIQNILAPGSLDAATRLVLANAIYFKGIWSKPFDKAQTSPQPFHLSSSSQADVPLMHHLDNVKYTENGDFQAVELPYGSNQLSMAVFLPRAVDGCSQLENRLNPDLLSKTVTDMRKREVDIFLPRFKLESKFELNDPLSQMGMEDAFGPKADFSGMDGTRLLYISAVIHKAWGEVNEEGTEAAAATVVGMRALSAAVKPAPPVVFRADHPFLFLIRETRSGSVLFLGRLADPSK
jgi:serine protease inhibitor